MGNNNLKENTSMEDNIVVLGRDWTSEIFYYAERKGLMDWENDGIQRFQTLPGSGSDILVFRDDCVPNEGIFEGEKNVFIYEAPDTWNVFRFDYPTEEADEHFQKRISFNNLMFDSEKNELVETLSTSDSITPHLALVSIPNTVGNVNVKIIFEDKNGEKQYEFTTCKGITNYYLEIKDVAQISDVRLDVGQLEENKLLIDEFTIYY